MCEGFRFIFCLPSGPLRTIYSRAQTFKEMFKYVDTKKGTLGTEENTKEQLAYYIPVIETLKGLLESELWKNSVSNQYFGATPDVLCDIKHDMMDRK